MTLFPVDSTADISTADVSSGHINRHLTALLPPSAPYRSILLTYGTLALRSHLTAAEAQQLDDILNQATDDPLLSVWLDDLDQWLAQQLPLLSRDAVRQQQAQIQQRIAQAEGLDRQAAPSGQAAPVPPTDRQPTASGLKA